MVATVMFPEGTELAYLFIDGIKRVILHRDRAEVILERKIVMLKLIEPGDDVEGIGFRSLVDGSFDIDVSDEEYEQLLREVVI